MWFLIQTVLAVAIGAFGMYMYLVDFKGYRKPAQPGNPPGTPPSIDAFRK